MRIKALVTSILFFLLVAVHASGQGPISVNAKIPFAFSVEGKVLPAGQYNFSEGSDLKTMTVRSSDGKASVIAPIMTRLAAEIHTTPQDAHIVFDKVGDSNTLAEIWVPGEQGFMLHATKGKHEHRIVDAPK
jgi:hypothetical protein